MTEGNETKERRRGPDARRAHQSAFVPLVLLLVVLAIVGVLNTNLVEPYTGPRAVADETSAFVFYDNADKDGRLQERSFFLRKTADGRKYDKAQRVEGTLVSTAILSSEHLVCLFPDFFSIYSRPRGLEREWSGAATTEALGFDPHHVGRMGNTVYAFGTTRDGALRAARLDPELRNAKLELDPQGNRRTWKLVPLDGARLEKAADAPAPEVVERLERADDSPAPVPTPLVWAGAIDQDAQMTLLFRVPRYREKAAKPTALRPGDTRAGIVRLVRFDGTAFVGSTTSLDVDLTTLAAISASGVSAASSSSAALNAEVLVYGTKLNDPEAKIYEFALRGPTAADPRPVLTLLDAIPYARAGLFQDRGVQALAAVAQKGKVLLFAQIGDAVKVAVKENGKWGEWIDLAKMPTEALALVYVYVAALLALTAIMVVSGVIVLRRRLRGGLPGTQELDAETAKRLIAEALGEATAASSSLEGESSRTSGDLATTAGPVVSAEVESEHDASIPDRAVAFGIDFVIVFFLISVVFVFLRQAFGIDLTARANDDPTCGLALTAWTTLGLIAYFVFMEAAFGRSPGKRVLGLEVRAKDGGEPSLLARIYRNLFRVELIFVATLVHIPPWGEQRVMIPVPVLALLVMVATPRTQRPGDLVAGTVVQRAHSRPPGDDE